MKAARAPEPNPSAPGTKERILDAAEHLFAKKGVDGTSLRAVISEAQVNLAAVHYHFGSKEDLLKHVVKRRTDPLNAESLAMLDRLEEQYGARPIPVEQVVRAFLEPKIRLFDDPHNGPVFAKLMGRLFAEPDFFFGHVAPSAFEEARARFFAAFQRSLPGLPPEELVWRMVFTMGTMAHTMRVGDHIPGFFGYPARTLSAETMIERMVAYTTAGIEAPCQETKS